MSAYPHPVLTAKTDDISGDISFIPEFVNNALHIKNIKVSNKYLTNLLGSQKAKFSLIIEMICCFLNQHLLMEFYFYRHVHYFHLMLSNHLLPKQFYQLIIFYL